MIDGMTLLLPLAVLAIVALFPFVGCGKYLPPDEDPVTPPPSPPTQPDPATPPPPPPPPPPPKPPPPATILELRLRPDINVIPAQPPNATKDGVERVVVTWTLSKSTALPGDPLPQPLEITIVRTMGTASVIDPVNSLPAVRYLTSDQLKLYDRVTCQCVVTTRPIAGGGSKPPVTVVTNLISLVANSRHIVQLEPVWTNPTANPRQFSLALLPNAPATGPAVPTRLQLNPSTDALTHINEVKPAPAPQYKVLHVKVTWTLAKAAGPVDQPLIETMVRTVGTRAFLEPDGTLPDPPAMWDLTDEQLAIYDSATCQCVVTTRPTTLTDPDTDEFPTLPLSFTIKKQTVHVIELEPDWTQVNAKPRRFTLRVQI